MSAGGSKSPPAAPRRPADTPDWWADPDQWAGDADRRAAAPPPAAYRFGDVTLQIGSDYRPLLDDLDAAYAECAVAPEGDGGARLTCDVRLVEDGRLVALRFTGLAVPDLIEAAYGLVKPRAELQHFVPQEAPAPGWRMLGNTREPSAPLLVASADRAIVDLWQEPGEFLLNYVVGVTQLAQPSVVFAHGGGVTIEGAGVLLIGRSGSGKSTTTAALASRGHPFLGDETIAIRVDSGELLPVRSTLKLRPGARPRAVVERLGQMRYDTRQDGQGLDCAWIRPADLFRDDATPPPTRLHSVFFLRQLAERAAVEPFVPSLAHLYELQALPMSEAAVVSWTTSPARRLMRFVRLIELLGTRRCYYLDLGPPDETAAVIEGTVTEAWH
jgi:hypothetical protein